MKKIYSRLMLIVLISVLLFFCALTVQAKAANNPLHAGDDYSQQEVRGIVSDQAGIPLPGVTVAVKGKNRGTTTDIDGQYSITIEPNDILIFSFVGFQTFEEPVNGRREMNVRLEEEIGSLGEVQINAGYYNTTKRESTGNISRVTAEEIELQPVISPLQALQGRMAGVEIIPGGNQPGMASTIRIRGRNSLREDGNFPLYIIDGVPINSTPIESNSLIGNTGMDPLNTLNISNIESIEVLKDADATAIYGTRGANGVVLITTKKGKDRITGLDARVYKGVSTVPHRLDLLNTQQYLQIRRQAFENDDVEPTIYNAYDLVQWDQNRYTDWQDFFFGGTSPVTDVNLALSGGSDNTTYRISGSYFNQGTVYPADLNYQKMTGGLNLSHTTRDEKIQLNLSLNYGVDNNRLLGNGVNLNSNAFRLPPNAPSIFNTDGSLHWEEWGEAGISNPLEGFFNSSQTQSYNLVSNLGITYQFSSHFSLRTNLGYTRFNSEELLKIPTRSYNPAYDYTHSSIYSQAARTSWIIEPQLIYSRKFGEGRLDAILGTTFQKSENSKMEIQGDDYASEVMIGNLNAAGSILNPSNISSEYRYSALFARLGFNWDQKYFINLTGRRDGSSRFGSGNRIANFGAIGGAWIFIDEPYVENNSKFLSFGKFRGSYGLTGNDQIGDYGYLDTYEATAGPGGLYPTQLSNPDYSWEINKKMEAAVDLGFFNDRLNLTLSWYKNQSSSQLVGYPLPAITGFRSVQANLPATVQNTGWEVELASVNVKSRNWRWQTFLNVSFPKNMLISYPGIEQSSYSNIYRVGHPLNIELLYEYEGLDPETNYYRIADVNEDGRLDYEDRVIIKDIGKEFFGGLTNNLTYKNFSLQFLWEFVKQEGTIRSLTDVGQLSNQRVEVLQALGNQVRFQRISQSYQAYTEYYNVLDTTFPFEDASFFRLKTLSLGLSLPQAFMESIRVKSGSLFINGQNLLTLTKFGGMDPEMPNGGTSFVALRTVTGGIQLNF
ncbi:SusC/RagA family TonB-linked outer membrane protein [Antarcticibacterium flavum]|uniref:SusC/RagA family TonB-linked outer membrane protein n=1 Tax=Antarcticibacterium flavum TaxID=2058175 RepID=A0A5B7X2Z3_9FLAO|nr:MULTISPECIES: SusC/RagA family TonB-linked outer membrane protein [Antarcticibacterium]MCM4161590.1 SusC/RagA family TonB-linked outer membrane protein [Antarcticibacterium sp. W02-3]QCY69041.1 SusC/RagA family TonB-linked outer membrane protein [Antarcticibacterium flavum]